MNLFVVLVSICILFPHDQTGPAVGSHLSAPELTLQPLFSNQRFPNVVIALDGTIVATWGQDHLRSRRSCDGGETWEPVVDIRRGDSIHGGGTIARFNLDWLLQGEPTGDGEVPASASR